MTDEELRLECLKVSVSNHQNANKVIQAEEFYTWITKDRPAPTPKAARK